MQNKTAITILAIALALVCIYQLSFTFATYKVRNDAEEFAMGDLVKQRAYLDSVSALPKEDWSYLEIHSRKYKRKR